MKKKYIIFFVLLLFAIGAGVYFFPNDKKTNCSNLSAHLLELNNDALFDKIVQNNIAEKTINCYTGNPIEKKHLWLIFSNLQKEYWNEEKCQGSCGMIEVYKYFSKFHEKAKNFLF